MTRAYIALAILFGGPFVMALSLLAAAWLSERRYQRTWGRFE